MCLLVCVSRYSRRHYYCFHILVFMFGRVCLNGHHLPPISSTPRTKVQSIKGFSHRCDNTYSYIVCCFACSVLHVMIRYVYMLNLYWLAFNRCICLLCFEKTDQNILIFHFLCSGCREENGSCCLWFTVGLSLYTFLHGWYQLESLMRMEDRNILSIWRIGPFCSSICIS